MSAFLYEGVTLELLINDMTLTSTVINYKIHVIKRTGYNGVTQQIHLHALNISLYTWLNTYTCQTLWFHLKPAP